MNVFLRFFKTENWSLKIFLPFSCIELHYHRVDLVKAIEDDEIYSDVIEDKRKDNDDK